jgi:hypothetical protein
MGLTRPERDADYSPPSTAEVEKKYEVYLLYPCAFVACNGTGIVF